MAVKPLLPHQPVTATGLKPSKELLEALQIVQREAGYALWGQIDGVLSDQVDLQAALNGKANVVHTHVAADITDSTAAGRAFLTAASAAAQTALLDIFASGLKGLVPASGGGTINFLRADGTWANPRPLNAPATKTADFTLGASEDWIINNKAGSDCVVTLPPAASNAGRAVTLKTIVGFAIVSVASDVVPLAGGAAGTAIVPAVAGAWATIVSDGTNWVIMAGS